MDDTLAQVQARVAERFPADLERIELQATPGHPLVVGELPGPPGAPRLLRYGMYDVQPAQEPDWTSPPFAAEVRDLPGVGPAVVARGSANSRGCLACFFPAAAVRARAGDLTAEGAFDLDLTACLDGQPELILGGKGLCDLELVCEAGGWGGPAVDHGSGLKEHIVGAAAFLLAYAELPR